MGLCPTYYSLPPHFTDWGTENFSNLYNILQVANSKPKPWSHGWLWRPMLSPLPNFAIWPLKRSLTSSLDISEFLLSCTFLVEIKFPDQTAPYIYTTWKLNQLQKRRWWFQFDIIYWLHDHFPVRSTVISFLSQRNQDWVLSNFSQSLRRRQ